MADVWSKLVERVRTDRQRITERLVDALRTELPEYQGLSRESVVDATAIDFEGFIALLEQGHPPNAESVRRSLDVARRRARAGFPLAVFLDSFNVARRVGHEVVEELGQELRLRVADRRRVERLVSDWTGSLMIQASRAFLELAGGETGTEDHRRDLLRRLFHSQLDAETQGHAALFGLHPDGRYRAFAARHGVNESAEDLAYEVTRTGSRGSVSALVAEMEGRVVGVVAQRPSILHPGATLGLGRETSLSEVQQSYAEACRVLNAATFAGRAGVFSLSDVALETAILEDPARSEALAVRYALPLAADDDASSSRILETVRLWLEHNGSVQEVADLLSLHPNTVRYRLQAYEDRTGEELSGFRARYAAWCAITWTQRTDSDTGV